MCVCLCVGVCDIPGSMEADRAARPPAATVVPREMRADRLASLCQGQQGPQGGQRGREGHRGRVEGGWRWAEGQIEILDEYNSTDLVTDTTWGLCADHATSNMWCGVTAVASELPHVCPAIYRTCINHAIIMRTI